jgi:site-specific DNA-methyltransferase (adenine-specific)
MKVTEKINLYNCDNMGFMKNIPDNYYDLAIVDPPYGINASKGTWGSSNKGKVTDYGKKNWDNSIPDGKYFIQLKRISKNQIIWGGNYFLNRPSPCWIVWDKLNSADFADCELAWTSFDTAVRKFEFRWNGMLQGDMKNKETRIHPTQKPVALYKWILDKYAKQGDKIFDSHLGSMSIAIACHDYGFELDGCELDTEYYDKGIQRVKSHISQLKLF